jgi:hypothetical protein
MAIDINEVEENGAFGPGIRITATRDGQPVMAPGTYWRVSIAGFGLDETVYYVDTFPYSGNDGWAFGMAGGFIPLQDRYSKMPHGAQARLLLELVENDVVVQSVSQAITYDTVTGLPLYVPQSATMAGGGGLTPDQATQIEETHEAVIVKMGVGENLIDVPIASLIAHPPLGLLEIDAVAAPAQGQGSIPPTAPGGELLYGLWWEFTVVPPEIGLLLGPTERYAERMIQLRTIHTVGGIELVSEVLDADFHRVIWLWSTAFPTRIDYDVLPGVVANIHGINNLLGPS